MITGTLKSKIDKLWLEFWASASQPADRPCGRFLYNGRNIAMEITLQPEAPPLRWDASGALRVGRSVCWSNW